MAFKDLSQGNENLLSSTVSTGDIELRSPAGISLYPDSDNTGNDNTVWLREGAKLVFEGPIGDLREIKITAPEPTGLPEDTTLTLPTIDGTFALTSDILNSEAALTLYIDTGDAITFSNANAHSDAGDVTTLLDANAYSDAGDAVTLLNANAYTDSAVSSGTGSLTTDDIPEASNLYYTDLRVNTYLTDNNYATESYADQAEADANTYTDGRETAITTAYQTYADTAEADANTYTDSRETAITTAYQTYADTAEADAISTSAIDATSKANTAESNANTYTDSRETAITTAYQTYADTAEADAISTAAADATTKANAAKADANSYTDGKTTKSYIDSLGIQASSVNPNSVTLGTDTTGNYISTISGTLNEVEVIGSGTETSNVTLGLPNNVTVGNDLTVGGDLFVTGTTVSIGAANLSVDDNFIYLNQGDAIGADGTIFTGTGLDDASFEGYFEGTTTTTYYVRIDSVGTPDTFEWSKDNFATTEATGIAITGVEQDLDNNIKFHASATTGHTLGDVWSGTAAPLNIDTGIFSNINTGTSAPGYTHVGVFYDASASSWKVFSEYDPEPNGDINTGDASFVLGEMEADCFVAREVELSQLPSVGNHATNKTYVDAADQSYQIANNLYADAVSANALSSANTYADTKLDATANAVSSSKWNTARTITLGGDLTGNVSIDGSQNVTLTATVLDDSHNHTIANIDGLQAALDNKLNTTANAVSSSKWNTARTITLGGDLSGNVSIDGSQNVTLTAIVADDSHNHTIANIDNLQTSLNGKAPLSHTHTIANINNLQTSLDDKAPLSHTHTIANVTNLQTSLDDKAPLSHTHTIANVTNLQTSLDSKLNLAGGTLSGDLTVATIVGTSGTLNVTGAIVATGDVTAFSDKRFKHNIVTIDNALEKVNALRGVNFEKDGEDRTGVIAQEVEEVLPEVVYTNPEGLKSVAYGNMVGVLIEAIKEQQLQIEQLQQEITKLNGKL